MTTWHRYFGPVQALVDDGERTITLSLSPRRGPSNLHLTDSELYRYLAWCIDWVEGFYDDYTITTSLHNGVTALHDETRTDEIQREGRAVS